MAKDLGDDVLPYRHGFQPTSHAPPSLDANWPDILERLLQLRLYCVQLRRSPAWMQVLEGGVLLMLPRTSVMKHQWSHRPLALGTIPNLTATS